MRLLADADHGIAKGKHGVGGFEEFVERPLAQQLPAQVERLEQLRAASGKPLRAAHDPKRSCCIEAAGFLLTPAAGLQPRQHVEGVDGFLWQKGLHPVTLERLAQRHVARLLVKANRFEAAG